MGIPYDPTKPASNDKPANDQAPMQSNFASIKTLIDVDHVDFANGQYGQHNQVTFATNNVPSVPTSPPILFTDLPTNHSGTPNYAELFFYSGSAGQGANQYVLTGSNGSVLLMGGIILKWGTLGAGVNNTTYNVFSPAFPNNCFGVQVTINIASSLQNVGINGFSATGFTFRTSASGGVPITYFAIGN